MVGSYKVAGERPFITPPKRGLRVTVVAGGAIEGPQGSPPAWIVPSVAGISVSFRIPSKRFLLASKRLLTPSLYFLLAPSIESYQGVTRV